VHSIVRRHSAALHQLTAGAAVAKYCVELTLNGPPAAAASGIATVQGNLFDTDSRVGSFSFLYLNPPYDSEIGSMGNKRMEYSFLEHTFRRLAESGVLLMVVPQERLGPNIPLLAANFTDLQVYRLTNPESERFDQVALLGMRKRVRGAHHDRNHERLLQLVWSRSMPTLSTGQRRTDLNYIAISSKQKP
jgi:hypothetical protein